MQGGGYGRLNSSCWGLPRSPQRLDDPRPSLKLLKQHAISKHIFSTNIFFCDVALGCLFGKNVLRSWTMPTLQTIQFGVEITFQCYHWLIKSNPHLGCLAPCSLTTPKGRSGFYAKPDDFASWGSFSLMMVPKDVGHISLLVGPDRPDVWTWRGRI